MNVIRIKKKNNNNKLDITTAIFDMQYSTISRSDLSSAALKPKQ